MRTKANLDKVRAAVHLIVATSDLGGRVDNIGDASSALEENSVKVATVDVTKEGVQPTRRDRRKSILVGLTDSPE